MRSQAAIGMMILGISLATLAMCMSCTDPEAVELAEMRRVDAETRLASAQAQGTVNVIQAETDAHIQRLRTEADLSKEMRQFDAAMARQEFSTALLEIQALQIALRETREVVAPLEENTRAAAENSWWALTLLPLGAGIILLCTGGLILYSNQELGQRLTALEESIGREQTTTTQELSDGPDATEEG